MNSTTDPLEPGANLDVAGSQVVPLGKPLSIRIVGVGGAGGNAIAHMAQTDLRELRPVALQQPDRLRRGGGHEVFTHAHRAARHLATFGSLE